MRLRSPGPPYSKILPVPPRTVSRRRSSKITSFAVTHGWSAPVRWTRTTSGIWKKYGPPPSATATSSPPAPIASMPAAPQSGVWCTRQEMTVDELARETLAHIQLDWGGASAAPPPDPPTVSNRVGGDVSVGGDVVGAWRGSILLSGRFEGVVVIARFGVLAFFCWREGATAGADVVAARSDEAVVVELLDDVRRPAGDASGRDHGREEIDGDAERVEERRRVEIDVGDELLRLVDARVELDRHLVPLELAGLPARLLRHSLEDRGA